MFTEMESRMILIITSQGPDPTDPVDPRFGRAPYLLIFDTETDQFQTLDNSQQVAAAQGAGVQAAQNIVATGAQVLLTGRCGPKAFQALSAAGVQIFSGTQGTVQEAVQAWRAGNLDQLTDPNGRPQH